MIKSVKVVCDAGPIIHLDELNCLDLLADFQDIILSDKVNEEITRYRPLALQRPDLPFRPLSGKTPADEPLIAIYRIYEGGSNLCS